METITQLIHLGDEHIEKTPQKSYDYFIEAFQRSKEIENLEMQGKALLGISHACRSLSKSSIGFKYAHKAQKIYESLNDREGLARSNNFLGIFYFYSGLYEQALMQLFSAKKNIDLDTPLSLKISILNNIAEVYRNIGDVRLSVNFYSDALFYAQEANHKVYESIIFSNIGEVYYNIQNYEEAKKHFLLAKNTLPESDDAIYISQIRQRLGQLALMDESFDEALHYFNESEEIISSVNHQYYQIEFLINKYHYAQAVKSGKSLDYLYDALDLAESSKSKKKQSDLLKLISDYYEVNQDYQNSLKYFKQYFEIQNEIETSRLLHKIEILKIENQLHETSRHLKNLIEKNELLEYSALYDELTSLPNRRLINLTFDEIFTEKQSPCWIAILDLDRFKWVNDGMGHLFGDECLIQVSQLLENILLEKKGFVGRFGGEEFIIALPETDYYYGKEVLNDILSQMKNKNILFNYRNQEYQLNASIGATYNTLLGKTPLELIDEADQALYIAKSQGRNQLVVAHNN